MNRFEVLCCALASVGGDLLERYESLLSDEESKRLRSFRASAAAKEFLVGRALLRTALAERVNCDARELRFAKNADGKPALEFPPSKWQFNLTHSHDWVALALCEGGSVGIDIESRTRGNNLQAIAQRFFSREENARLAHCAESEWLDYFFAVWTLKEAHAKALGCGLPKILTCSSIDVDLNKVSIDFTLSAAASTDQTISAWLYRIDKQCSLAVVAHGDDVVEPKFFEAVPQRSIQPISLIKQAESRHNQALDKIF